MPSWNDLVSEIDSLPDDPQRSAWIINKQTQALQAISDLRGGRNVILYASAFLQKPTAPAYWLQLTFEEINAFMSVVYGMDCAKGLTLVLHTPGGMTNAAETVVSYLNSKFKQIEVIVPAFAMSAGTMIALASERIVMGRQSQLGPIDPQMPLGGNSISARAVVDQFERAKLEVLTDLRAAHVWAPILQSVGPALLQEAQNALEYSRRMVGQWLAAGMFASDGDKLRKADAVASYFADASHHKSHGRRIDRSEARQQGLVVEDLEDNQTLQEAVLTSYHTATITFEKGPSSKVVMSNSGRIWVKNVTPAPARP